MNEGCTIERVIDALLHAIKGVLQGRSWVLAFWKNGFGSTFEGRARVLETAA